MHTSHFLDILGTSLDLFKTSLALCSLILLLLTEFDLAIQGLIEHLKILGV